MNTFLHQWVDETGIGKVGVRHYAQGAFIKELPCLTNYSQNRIPESHRTHCSFRSSRSSRFVTADIAERVLPARKHHSENGETQESASQIAYESSYGPMMSNTAFLAVYIAAALFPSLHAYHFLASLGAVGGVNSKKECSVDVELIFQRLYKKTHQNSGYLIYIPLILREKSLKTSDSSAVGGPTWRYVYPGKSMCGLCL